MRSKDIWILVQVAVAGMILAEQTCDSDALHVPTWPEGFGKSETWINSMPTGIAEIP